jgi:hypothetical protein
MLPYRIVLYVYAKAKGKNDDTKHSFQSKNSKERKHLRDNGVDGRIILNYISKR